MQITTYLEKSMQSELSANVIDLCPVGALTSKPYAFEARPWELKKTESIDVLDAVGSNIRVDTYGWEVKRILPRLNNEINEEWISDKTRYSCDGLLKQRLDTPYIKKQNKLVRCDWDEAIKVIGEKFKNTSSEKIAGHLGDLTSIETSFSFKKLFESIKSKNLESREKKFYVNLDDKINYLFNSTIQGIEEADLIILIGCNPRLEATMVNARIRKSYLKNKLKIFSFGDPGNLTYDYEIIGNNTNDLKEFFSNKLKNEKIFKDISKPIVIMGESILQLKSGGSIFEETKNFLFKNNFITEKWNALNVLIQNASTVGNFDLNLVDNRNFKFFDNLNDNKFEVIYLLGSDNLDFKKKNEFIIYQGSHGDRGAEIADIILPSPTYTEQSGLFSNLEGRVQECRKASYPIGQAKEDWKIFNLISKQIHNKNLFNSFKEVREEAIKSIKNFNGLDLLPKKMKSEFQKKNLHFEKELININPIDYYFSNSISRASKTMADCRRERNINLKEGTNN